MDYVQIASATVAWISPFLPYLLNAVKASGKKFADILAEKGGDVAWGTAQTIWEKVTKGAEKNPELKGASMMVAAKPTHQTYQAIFIDTLAQQLKSDPSMAKDLMELLGGKEAVQKVLADNNSVVERAKQEMKGSGKQIIKASKRSTIKGVTQVKRDR
jgi:hypothetical protein